MQFIPALGTWGLCLLAGFGFLQLAGLRRNGPEGVGLALLAGAALLALFVTLFSIPGWVTAPVLAAAMLGVGAFGVFEAFRGPEARPSLCGGSWLAFSPALLVVALAFAQAASRPVYNVDAQRRWVLHGQWTAEYETATPPAVEDATWGTNHPSYPPLITGVTALALELGADRDTGLRPLFPVFLFALLAVVFGFARRRAGPRVAGLITLSLALVPALSFADELGLGAAAAHADVALAAFLTALGVLFLDRLEDPDRTPLLAIVAITVGCVWTKNEGMAFALVMLSLTAVLLLFARNRRGARDSFTLFAAALVATLVWKVVARNMPVAEGEDYVSGGILALLAGGFERLPDILGRLGAELVDFTLWGPVWLLAGLWVLAAAAGKVRTLVSWLPLVWMVLGFSLVIAAYMVTGWKDGRFIVLMDVSLARLLLHHAPLVALMIVMLFPSQPAPGSQIGKEASA